MGKIEIRRAVESDLDALLQIYNYEVEYGVATLDLTLKTIDEWRVWFAAHNVDNHPLFTALYDGEIAGYVSLSPYREKRTSRLWSSRSTFHRITDGAVLRL